MAHLFSVDVEEHFQVSAFEHVAPPDTWDALPSRVVRNTDRLLGLLAKHDTKGTFFTLGWVAERQPDLIRRIADAGHEIASHGWWHRRVTTQSPEEFRQEVRDTKSLLEEVSGTPVSGFRAPSFSIVRGTEWALDVLLEEGYTYDSSLFPIRRRGYGYTGGGVEPYQMRLPSGTLWEFPPATATLFRMRIPAAGGGYLRQLPRSLIHHAFSRSTHGMFYIHPWEVDPDQPRMPVPWLTRARHYRNLHRTEERLDRLLRAFRFTSVSRWFDAQ